MGNQNGNVNAVVCFFLYYFYLIILSKQSSIESMTEEGIAELPPLLEKLFVSCMFISFFITAYLFSFFSSSVLSSAHILLCDVFLFFFPLSLCKASVPCIVFERFFDCFCFCFCFCFLFFADVTGTRDIVGRGFSRLTKLRVLDLTSRFVHTDALFLSLLCL